MEYSLRAIPLGGYVAFPDDDPKTAEKFPPDDPDLLKNRSIPERALVISAGVLANCIFALAILTTQARCAWPTLLPGTYGDGEALQGSQGYAARTGKLFIIRLCRSAPAYRIDCRWFCPGAHDMSGTALSACCSLCRCPLWASWRAAS